MSQLVRTRRDINGKTLELVLYQDFTTAGQGLDADNLIVINKESKQRNLSEIERVYLKKDFYYFEIYCYSHSGVSFSLTNTTYPYNDRWDAGLYGYGLVSKKEYPKYNKAKEFIEKCIIFENAISNGEIIGFTLAEVTKCPCCGKEEVNGDILGGEGYTSIDEILEQIPKEFSDVTI